MDEQKFYYGNFAGRILGNSAREELILREMHHLQEGDFFLEVGCAQGHFERHAALLSGNIFGADTALAKLRQARHKSNGSHFTAGNAEQLPFKSSSFDFVLCSEVLEHVPDWRSAVLELQRVARERILVTVPLEKGFFWRLFSVFAPMHTRGHLHRLDSRDVESAVGKGWQLSRREVIATPSRRLNRLLNRFASERAGIYSLMLFERKAKGRKGK